MTARRPDGLAPALLKALREVYPNWDSLQERSRQMHVAYVGQRSAEGLRAWVKSRPLVRRRGVPDPIPREHPGEHGRSPLVGYRDTYILPDGQVVHEDKITNPKDPAYRKDTKS